MTGALSLVEKFFVSYPEFCGDKFPSLFFQMLNLVVLIMQKLKSNLSVFITIQLPKTASTTKA